MSTPCTEKYGAQPPIELLRQLIDQKGWYDRKTNSFKNIIDIQLVAAMQGTGNFICLLIF
jgi:dynein heavy chain